jgi:transcriptional regulator with XRE-family HTH domain
MSHGLGARLRDERERRRIDLATIASTTKVNAALFEGLERDDISRWPAGIFRRSFVRAYARAIGLDPEATLREFLEQFPDPVEPPQPTRLEESHAIPQRLRRPHTGLRLTLADVPVPCGGGSVLAKIGKRCAAVALDGATVLAIAFGLFAALGRFWTPLAVFALCYYGAATLVLGSTPGVWLFTPGGTHRGAPAPRPAPAPALADAPEAIDVAYDRGIGAIASVSGPLSSS